MSSADRFAVLDSLRALAALFVVGFHFVLKWTDELSDPALLPRVPVLTESPVFLYGSLGVELFFIISGFVIALTLNRTAGLSDFARKRFARLFPAMLICAVFTYVWVSVFDVWPLSDVEPIDFLPSLTFVSPIVYNALLGIDSDWISGVYWSLFVEVKFYALAAAIYFWNRSGFVRNFVLVSALLSLAFWAAYVLELKILKSLLLLGFFPKYAGLFVAGIGFHAVFSSEGASSRAGWGVVLLGYAYTMLVYSPLGDFGRVSWGDTVVLTGFFLLFLAFVTNSPYIAPLRSRVLARIGAASYSLYLLHESVGVPLLVRLNEYFGESSLWILPVTAFVIWLSIVFFDYIETPARTRLLRE